MPPVLHHPLGHRDGLVGDSEKTTNIGDDQDRGEDERGGERRHVRTDDASLHPRVQPLKEHDEHDRPDERDQERLEDQVDEVREQTEQDHHDDALDVDHLPAAARVPPTIRDGHRRRREPSLAAGPRARTRCYTTAAMAVPSVFTPRPQRLRSCWHAVAYSRDLGESPLRVELLEEALVLWRDSRGVAHAFRDLCIHRGTALSRGRWPVTRLSAHTTAGVTRSTAAAPPYRSSRIPPGCRPRRAWRPIAARSGTASCGRLWMSRAGRFPSCPSSETPGWKTVLCGPYAWNAEASRQIENFTDLGHFPWVHPGLLGDPNRVVVIPPEVATRGHVLPLQVRARGGEKYLPVPPVSQRGS